ncbi:MAG: hypothetical protein J4473_01355 [Candidatus Aenigmarchaeota archaeon]|nr:hypothetical protein [Candidatus Aenigmarchaeota archaeon]
MAKILLVEDNPEYAGPAEHYLNSGKNEIVLAVDYSQATDRLTTPGIDYVITDCFFPEITGTGNIELGRELVRKMAYSDPVEKRMIDGLEVLGQYINLSDSEMRKYARFLISISRERDITQSPVMRAIRQVSVLDEKKEIATRAAKSTLRLIYMTDQAPRDDYEALMRAMEESEANQPLGILIAERADELKLPSVLTTSTYHHDMLTQPIQNYAGSKGWTLVDCGSNKEDDKASCEFWERVSTQLESRIT